jgi:hypothetical protein
VFVLFADVAGVVAAIETFSKSMKLLDTAQGEGVQIVTAIILIRQLIVSSNL